MMIEEMKEAMRENPPVNDGPGDMFTICKKLKEAFKDKGDAINKLVDTKCWAVYHKLHDLRVANGEKDGDIDEAVKLVLAEV